MSGVRNLNFKKRYKWLRPTVGCEMLWVSGCLQIRLQGRQITEKSINLRGRKGFTRSDTRPYILHALTLPAPIRS